MREQCIILKQKSNVPLLWGQVDSLLAVKPDLIIFLDISPQQGLRRALKRGKADRIEQESLSFFTEVYDSYHQHIKTMSHVKVIDASLPLPQVQQLIHSTIEQYIHENA